MIWCNQTLNTPRTISDAKKCNKEVGKIVASKRTVQAKSNKKWLIAAVSCVFVCAIAFAAFASFEIASADRNGNDTSVGLNENTSFNGVVELSSLGGQTAENDLSGENSNALVFSERTSLAIASYCDISSGLEIMNARLEQERIAAEEAQRIDEENHIKQAQEAQAAWPGASSLSSVDFTVGKEAFIEEWTERIDAYLEGSNLAGYGQTFAEAAWEYGVDPRWSPAISNTESGKGANCFLPYNAWGWGSSSWSNWTDAIWTHVAGLAKGYGYSITESAASVYCPPNSTNWYYNTLSEMARI
jgi:hypothetical protein